HARERDLAGRGGDDRVADLRRDVDAPVLAGGIRVGAVPVLRDHLTVDRPGPVSGGEGGRRRDVKGRHEDGDEGEWFHAGDRKSADVDRRPCRARPVAVRYVPVAGCNGPVTYSREPSVIR